jgi:hypothetical protein
MSKCCEGFCSACDGAGSVGSGVAEWSGVAASARNSVWDVDESGVLHRDTNGSTGSGAGYVVSRVDCLYRFLLVVFLSVCFCLFSHSAQDFIA